jgi:hypothetical protein
VKSLLLNALAAKPRCNPGPRRLLGEGNSGSIDRIRAAAWRHIGPPFVLDWIDGLKLNVTTRDETYEAIFRTGEFEPNEFHWLDGVLKPGMTFVDIGCQRWSVFAVCLA